MDSVRIMVFYDGNYFKQGQVYFRYHEKRGWFDLQELHNLIEKYVAGKTKESTEITKVVAAPTTGTMYTVQRIAPRL